MRLIIFLRFRRHLVRPMRPEGLAHLQIAHGRIRERHDYLRIHAPNKDVRVADQVRDGRDDVLREDGRVGGRDHRHQHEDLHERAQRRGADDGRVVVQEVYDVWHHAVELRFIGEMRG